MQKEKKKKIWAPNPITQDAAFQRLRDTPLSKSSSLRAKSIPSVWRICAPVGIVAQTHAAVYDALGRQKCFLPLSYLLNQSPPRVLLFPVCLRSKTLISNIQFRHGFVASTMKCPESFSTSLGNCSYYYWALSDESVQPESVQQKLFFFSVTYFCCCSFLYILRSANCEELHGEIIRVGCFLSCPRCSPKLFFLSAATALKRNSAQKKNCSLTAVVSLKVFLDLTHIFRKKKCFCMSSYSASC